MSTTKVKRQLPTLAELHHDMQTAFKNDKLNLLLNQPPLDKWIQNNPFYTIKNDQGKEVAARYIPIGRIELLMTQIFQNWWVEVINYSLLANAVAVHVRLHYVDPITGDWKATDGLGAKSLQVDRGVAASNLSAIKQEAVQMALPSAKSYAIKDAAEHLGALFGRDLNRKESLRFSSKYEDHPVEEKSDNGKSESTLSAYNRTWEAFNKPKTEEEDFQL